MNCIPIRDVSTKSIDENISHLYKEALLID